MKLQVIKTDLEYEAMLGLANTLLDKKVSPISADGENLQVVLLLIKQYEDVHYVIPIPDAISVIKLKMEEKGLRNTDFVGKIGSKGYVSALLNKRKPLTLALAKWFHKELNIPADVLLA